MFHERDIARLFPAPHTEPECIRFPREGSCSGSTSSTRPVTTGFTAGVLPALSVARIGELRQERRKRFSDWARSVADLWRHWRAPQEHQSFPRT